MSTARQSTNKLLEMIEQCMLDRDTVIMACVKYMSEADVADMMHINEFADDSPDFDQYDSDDYDVEAMRTDYENGNFDPDNSEEYRCVNIVRASLINGQFDQAKEQCEQYGLEYREELSEFNKAGEEVQS